LTLVFHASLNCENWTLVSLDSSTLLRDEVLEEDIVELLGERKI
jgi:hypothetical protein